MTPARKQKRIQLAAAINEKINAARRTDLPPEEAIGEWVMSINMDTNQPTWAPKDLFDEYQRLRFSEEGAP
jgi:hypothetical protein